MTGGQFVLHQSDQKYHLTAVHNPRHQQIFQFSHEMFTLVGEQQHNNYCCCFKWMHSQWEADVLSIHDLNQEAITFTKIGNIDTFLIFSVQNLSVLFVLELVGIITTWKQIENSPDESTARNTADVATARNNNSTTLKIGWEKIHICMVARCTAMAFTLLEN